MPYTLRLIGRDRPTLKRRIAESAAPDALRVALTAAVDDLVTEDSSLATYVTLIEAQGNDEPGEISATFSVRRIEATDDVLVIPANPDAPFSAGGLTQSEEPAVIVTQPVVVDTAPAVA